MENGLQPFVTLLFSGEQYLAAAEAFLRGIERRLEAVLKPNVGSVASVFVSVGILRWRAPRVRAPLRGGYAELQRVVREGLEPPGCLF